MMLTPDQLNALSEDDLKALVRSYARQRLYAQRQLDHLGEELIRRVNVRREWAKRQRIAVEDVHFVKKAG